MNQSPKKSSKKKDLLIDMDGVLVHLLGSWLENYRNATGDNVQPVDITEWEVSRFVKEPKVLCSLLNEEGAFFEPAPLRDVLDWFPRLLKSNKARVTILTQAPTGSKTAVYEKRQWMSKWFPSFNIHNMIFAHHKYMIRGDLMLDDNPVHLEKAKESDPSIITVVFDQLYNKDAKADYRVSTWEEFYQLVNKLWT